MANSERYTIVGWASLVLVSMSKSEFTNVNLLRTPSKLTATAYCNNLSGLI